MMVEIFYRYRVHPAQAPAFEHAYGPDGPWARLFRKHPGYRRTRLFRHKFDPQVYVTIDVWNSKPEYDAFRNLHAEEYRRLDGQLALLKLEESALGYYEGEREYHPPVDTKA